MAQDRTSLRAAADVARRPVVARTAERSAAASSVGAPGRSLSQRLGNAGTQILAARLVAQAGATPATPPTAAAGQLSIPAPGQNGVSHLAASAIHAADANGLRPMGSAGGPLVQRRCAECEEETKRASSGGSRPIQASLTVGKPGDPYEQEADRVADTVMRMPAPPARPPSISTLSSTAQAHAKEDSAPAPQVAPEVEANVRTLQSEGGPLPPASRALFEPRFGADFSQVRVNTGTRAQETAKSLGARAFTVGKSISFGAGQYAPESKEGKHLLAHELTHVVQQSTVDTSLPSRAALRVEALQQPRPADRLRPLRLTPAPATMLMRQPSAIGPIAARQDARAKLEDLPAPPSLAFLLGWLGDEPFSLHLLSSIYTAIGPTLDSISALEVPWKAATNGLRRFQLRVSTWNLLRSRAGRTDDPALLLAARDLGNAAYDLCGPRWAILLKAVNATVAFASQRSREWNGLSTLMPVENFMLRRLGPELKTFLDGMAGDPSVLQNVRTVLGCPKEVRSNAAVASWVDGIYQQYDGLVHSLGRAASNIETSKFDTSSFTKLGAQAAIATSLGTNLKQVIDLMSRPEGLTSQRPKLAIAFRTIRAQVGTLRTALRPPESTLTYAFNNFSDVLGTFAGAAEALSPGRSYEWLKDAGRGFEAAISKQEPELLEIADATLGLFEDWCGLVVETLAEADTLDEEAPKPPAWWQVFRMWNWKEIKEAFVTRLLDKVPLLKELVKEAADLWRRAASAFERFKERVFKEGRILAPLWEFFLSVIGLETPSEFVRDVADRAASLLGKVLKHPIRFLKGLASAVKLGLKNFGLNIGNHLLTGILDWLFDQFNLPSPPTFGGIVKALAAKIGLEVSYICKRIAVYLRKRGHHTTGPQVEKRLRDAIKVGAVTFRWFGYLINREFGKLWEEIKGYFVKFWQWVIDKAVHYVMTTLKENFISWLKTLVDPTGLMAALQFIKAIYAAIQTIIAYAKKLLDLVREVFRAIRDIAEGKIEGAAAWVESGAVKVLSVLIAFVARYLKLDSVVKALHEGLGWVKETIVTPALDTLIGVAGDIWDWIFAKAKQALEWWRNRGKFRDPAGDDRSLYYQDTTDAAVLYVSAPETKGKVSVAATPEPLVDYLPHIPAPTKREQGIKDEISNMAGQIAKVKKDTGGGFGAANGELIHTLFNEIVVLLGELGGKGMQPPPTKVDFKTKDICVNGKCEPHGKKMEAKILSTNPGDNIGSAPTSSETELWKEVGQWRTKSGSTSYYIKGHLLNHNLHGPGTWINMMPIARTTNARMESEAEGPVKQAVLGENKVVLYTVDMIYGSHVPKAKTPAEDELPSRVEMEAEELTYSKGKWQKSGVMIAKAKIDNDIR
jgi:hypothetical protein